MILTKFIKSLLPLEMDSFELFVKTNQWPKIHPLSCTTSGDAYFCATTNEYKNAMLHNFGKYLYGAIFKDFAYEEDLKHILITFNTSNARTGFKKVGWDYNGTRNPDRLRILIKTPDSYYEYNKTDFKKTDQKPQ